MLLLSRKEDETIMIGDDICIRVVGIHNFNVVLGVTAPRQVSVHRQEIYDKIRLEKNIFYKSKKISNDQLIELRANS